MIRWKAWGELVDRHGEMYEILKEQYLKSAWVEGYRSLYEYEGDIVIKMLMIVP